MLSKLLAKAAVRHVLVVLLATGATFAGLGAFIALVGAIGYADVRAFALACGLACAAAAACVACACLED